MSSDADEKAPPKSRLKRIVFSVAGVLTAVAGFLAAYDTVRNKGQLFVCDVLAVVGRTDLVQSCQNEKATPLENPELVPPAETDAAAGIDEAAGAVPYVARILEGDTDSGQRRIFDVTVQNPTDAQIILDRFDLRWRYIPGALASVEQAAVIEPTVAHSLDMKVDPSDTSDLTESRPVSPTIVLPAGTLAEPSTHVFRLELTYAFVERGQYHATADWNLEFSLDLTTTSNQRIPIFANEYWR